MTNKIPNSKIEQRLEELVDVPPRNPQQAVRGRAQFLNQAANYRQTVSQEMYARQRGWNFLFRKERRAMNVMISLILAAALILGGGATTVAAQDDLPTESLYPLKLWTENARLSLAGDPQEQANLLIQMSQTRVDEMAALAEIGITPPEQVQEQLALHLEQTLRLAAGMDDAVMTQTLNQLRLRLQSQVQILEKLQLHASGEVEQLLTRTREMLQNRLRLAELGLEDPQGFRYRVENNMRYGWDEDPDPEPNQQKGPGADQNEPPEPSGTGTQNKNGQNNEAPGGQEEDQNQFQNEYQNTEQNGQDTTKPGYQEQNRESNGSGDGGTIGQGDNGGNESGGGGGSGGGNGGGGNK